MKTKNQISQLIKACKACDPKAQKQLYLLFADEMMSIASRYAKDLPEARDIVHDTFLKVFRSIQKFEEGKGSFAGWIARILINHAIAKHRRQKKMVAMTEQDFTLKPSDDFSILDTLAAEDILKLIQELPDRSRTIFNLYVIEGFKHDEIGALLNISASTSRSQLTRAKKLLRMKMENQRPCIKAS